MDELDSKSDDSADEDYNPDEDLKAQKAAEAATKKPAPRSAGPLGLGSSENEVDAKTKRLDRWRRDKREEEDTKPLVGTEAVRKRKMDAMWADLNTSAPTVSAKRSKKQKTGKKKKGNSKEKKAKMLKALLGGGVLVGNLAKMSKGGLDFRMPAVVIRKSTGQQLITDKIEVSETVKFAGQTMKVTKTLTAGTKEAAEHAKKEAAKKHTTNLDNVLNSITKPTTISVTTKSSKDWDKFKAEQGIEEELEQSTKNGYLAKQDFLNRVDGRQFEIEKAARERKRAQKK